MCNLLANFIHIDFHSNFVGLGIMIKLFETTYGLEWAKHTLKCWKPQKNILLGAILDFAWNIPLLLWKKWTLRAWISSKLMSTREMFCLQEILYLAEKREFWYLSSEYFLHEKKKLCRRETNDSSFCRSWHAD